jgi:hypothetical protein
MSIIIYFSHFSFSHSVPGPLLGDTQDDHGPGRERHTELFEEGCSHNSSV